MKKIISGLLVLLLLVNIAIPTNSLAASNYSKNENLVINGEIVEAEDLEVQPKFIWFAVPAIAISDIVWATIGATAATGSVFLLWMNQPTLTNEIDTAYRAIPKKILDSDGSIDMGKFSQKVGGKTAYKDPKTGWEIDKDTAGHGGRKWKLKDDKGNRVASLDEKGRIISK
ncbi:hypothetical protein [Lysinibacillus sp. NPDC056232]|uniref:hypothetical protein n=1 Tax=Lysinibacillus sp. NPDC056232 TaxID=3345756 RepID=UPI0035E036A1